MTKRGATGNGNPTVVIRSGSTTDVGRKRKANEDSMLVGYPIFAIADGMGGHDAGDRASQTVVYELSALIDQPLVGPDGLAAVLARAHAAVGEISDESERGAGSTVTGVVVSASEGIAQWIVFNVGDSRVYRLRDGELAQLTVDHSLVQQLIDDGRLDASERHEYEGRNVITRAMGADDSDADYWMHPIVQNERLLLCSDGLCGEVDDTAIRAVLLEHPEPQAAADALVQLALDNGGRDNVSVIVLEVVVGGQYPLVDDETVTSIRRSSQASDDLNANTVEIPARKGRGRGRA